MWAAFLIVTGGIKLRHGAWMLEKNVKAVTSFRLEEMEKAGSLCSLYKAYELFLSKLPYELS